MPFAAPPVVVLDGLLAERVKLGSCQWFRRDPGRGVHEPLPAFLASQGQIVQPCRTGRLPLLLIVFSSASYGPPVTPLGVVSGVQVGSLRRLGSAQGLVIRPARTFPLPPIHGTDLIVAPTANMVPFDVVANTIVPARAYENQVYVAYANYCGHENGLEYCGLSCVAAPDGSDAARAGRDEELIFCELDHRLLTASRQATTYLADRRPRLYAALSTPTPEYNE